MLTADPPGGELVSLTYNAADQVVVKQTSSGTRKFVYDGKKLLLETKEDDTTDLTYDSVLTDEYGELTSRYHDATAGTDYFQFDGLGSTETMSDEAEADADVYRYKAFGQIVQQFGTEDNQFTFVGRQGYAYYPELELYFAGMSGGGQSAKAGEESKSGSLLDPVAARWLRPDPSRDVETNLYPYARNNPVNVTDPSGNTTILPAEKQSLFHEEQSLLYSAPAMPSVTDLMPAVPDAPITIPAALARPTLGEEITNNIFNPPEPSRPEPRVKFSALPREMQQQMLADVPGFVRQNSDRAYGGPDVSRAICFTREHLTVNHEPRTMAEWRRAALALAKGSQDDLVAATGGWRDSPDTCAAPAEQPPPTGPIAAMPIEPLSDPLKGIRLQTMQMPTIVKEIELHSGRVIWLWSDGTYTNQRYEAGTYYPSGFFVEEGYTLHRGPMRDTGSAGINRLGVGNARVLRGRPSQSLRPRPVR